MQRFRSLEDAAEIQFSSRPGPESFQSGAASHHPAGLQAETLDCIGGVARPCRVERRLRAGVSPCASVNHVTLTTPLATEFPDENHPGWVAARANKEEMRARLATIVAKLGVGDPNRVASQIALIINGAYATGLVAKPADLRGELVDAAMKLLA